MVTALEIARSVALKAAASAPERMAAIEAKRKANEAKASELHAALADLADVRVQIGKDRGVLTVSREPARVRLIAFTLERRDPPKGFEDHPVRWKMSTTPLCAWLAEGSRHGYSVKCRNGGDQSFSDIADAVTCIANDVGSVMILED